MKVLFVENQFDYDALRFEQQFDPTQYKDIWERTKKGEKFAQDEEGFNEEDKFEIQALEFDYVDPAFIEFVVNVIQDYDDTKHRNFYLV